MGFFDAINEFANAMATASENRYSPDEMRILLDAREILIKHNKATVASEINDVIRAANSGTVSSTSTTTTTSSSKSGYSAYEIKSKLIIGMLGHSHVHRSLYDEDIIDYKSDVYAKIDVQNDRVKVMISEYSSSVGSRRIDWSKPAADCILITAVYNGTRWSVSNVEKGTYARSTDTIKHFIENFQKEIYNL